jgi:holin family 2
MNLDSNEKTLIELAAVGMLMAAGKLLLGGKPVTLRLALGRITIGAGLSMAAGAALLEFPHLPPVGLIGLGSVLGIAGLELLETLVQRCLGKLPARQE